MSITIEKIAEKTLPTIALRGIVLFPHVITSFEIARKASIKALKQAQESGTELFLAIQRDASVISPRRTTCMKSASLQKSSTRCG